MQYKHFMLDGWTEVLRMNYAKCSRTNKIYPIILSDKQLTLIKMVSGNIIDTMSLK